MFFDAVQSFAFHVAAKRFLIEIFSDNNVDKKSNYMNVIVAGGKGDEFLSTKMCSREVAAVKTNRATDCSRPDRHPSLQNRQRPVR